MPSKFTENFNLSQWEAGDKVHHADFNEDNRKIDAAFLNHRSAELICEAVVESDDAVYLTLDLSRMDWSRYMALVVIVDCAKSDTLYADMGGGERCVHIASNTQTVSGYGRTADLRNAAHMTMLIPVFYNGNHTASALSFGVGVSGSTTVSSFACGGRPYLLNQCSQIAITHSSSFVPGDRAELWGVK